MSKQSEVWERVEAGIWGECVYILGVTHTHTHTHTHSFSCSHCFENKDKILCMAYWLLPPALCWSHVGFLLVSWVYHDPSCHKGSSWNVPTPIQELTPIHPWGLSFSWFLRRISSYPLPAPFSVPPSPHTMSLNYPFSFFRVLWPHPSVMCDSRMSPQLDCKFLDDRTQL